MPSPARRSFCFQGLLLVCFLAAWGWISRENGVAYGEKVEPPQAASHPAELGPHMAALVEADWVDADRRFATATAKGPAENAPAANTAEDAAGGCDGVKTGGWGFHTASAEPDPWWQVDLGRTAALDRVVVFNRTDGGTASRTKMIEVLVAESAESPEFTTVYQHSGEIFGGVGDGKPLVVDLRGKNTRARVVRLRVPGPCSFALDEVEVYAADDPAKNIALGRPADQTSIGRYSYAKPPAAGVPDDNRFSTAHIRRVIEQTRQLIARLSPHLPDGKLAPQTAKLGQVELRLAGLESGPSDEATRRVLYLEARRLKREVAFSNPLLDFDRILFIKRHDSVGVFHMCDQFYGCNARPGGGLFVLSDPFGPNPQLTDLLAGATVASGRLAGRKLEGGTFLSPELSFDGRTVLFAYSEAAAWPKYQGKECYEWTPECSYHIFKVQADGRGLEQLTDGAWNDFDPCFLPDGRVAFISERRGGYLRCGRNCPVYTTFAMQPDGSGIECLSFHETHEWQPSVTNDGMLVYTRWDYVDRDTNIAHHIWTSFPDGRDPRSFHGNYPERRESRPWMEMNIRAVPGSNKFVAVTGAHHGHAFGSLVLIDPRVEDDLASGQLTRLTPEVPFPEAEGKPIANYMIYGTPWPLSEDDYLCVYDADARNRGIYWIDRFGNRELIYRDAEISCLDPIPLRPRPVPPVIPSPIRAEEDTATVAVMNVYDADFAWPADTKIEALRVIQVLPKSTAPPNVPRIGVADQTNARAVLGTVPVEADGSAYFKAPAGKPIYFQAIDQRGTAVQSMRSATYLHAGERLTCQGCHERKHDPPSRPAELPLALRRPPAAIAPDVEGSNPFNFVRLVQPVLERNCVSCHAEKKAIDLSGAIEGAHGWTRSYANLAGKYGFYFHVGNGSINTGVHGGSRTTAGKFGARASELMKYLEPSHYDVQLSAEERHRVALWLDCNSEFYGSYENTESQARGEVVWPTLE